MTSAITVEEKPTNIAPQTEQSAEEKANKEQEIDLNRSIILAEAVRHALGKGSEVYQLYTPRRRETKEEGATTLWSIGSAAHKVPYVNINDIRAWSHVYGTASAVVLATLGRKSVWKMQAEMLGRPGRPGPGGSGEPDDPDDPEGPGGAWGRRGTDDQAAEEYKRTIETESQRIGVSVCISDWKNRNTEHDFGIGHHHRIHCRYCAHSTNPKSDSLGCSCLLDIQSRFQSIGRL